MIGSVRTMLTCRWAARRLQRYLDADPAVGLDPVDVARLETHLAACARCARRVQQYRELAAALHEWARRHAPDPFAVARVHETARMIAADSP